MRWLVLAVLLLPVVDLVLLVQMGNWWGAGPTVGLVAAGGGAGVLVTRRQWRLLAQGLRHRPAAGLPPRGLVDDCLVLAGGLLLLAPGPLSDLVSLWLLVPAARQRLRRWLGRWFLAWLAAGRLRLFRF